MANSTHRVEVFRVKQIDKHPNADKLEIMHVFDAYQAIVRKDEYKVGDLACYVPPDNILPDKPEYAFLKGHLRIRATKLRGIVSQGLVLPAPSGSNVGDDVAVQLGVTHYVPQFNSRSHGSGGGGNHGEMVADPPESGPNYDIDSWFRYGSLMEESMMVELTEKLHGTNTRASYQEGKFWMGSRNHFRRHDKNTLYWRVFYANPWLKRLCRNNPGYVIYGETYGNIQDLKYGMPQSEDFRVFDIWTGTRFLNWFEKTHEMEKAMEASWYEKLFFHLHLFFTSGYSPFRPLKPWGDDWHDHYVPILYTGMYSREVVEQYMNGDSNIPGATHVREGVVIKPFQELWHPHIGRLVLKAVSPDYLGR